MTVQAQGIFKQRVSELMKRMLLTKKDMAQRLNVDYSTFWRKLNGQRNVDMGLLKQIAEILGTSTAYLIGETDNPTAIPNPSGKKGYELDYTYWGSVVNNSRNVLQNGKREDIAYVSQMLKMALSLLNTRLEIKTPAFSEKASITNMPFIVGDNNESNLTLTTE